jgi:hypothetical protein
VAYYFTFSAIVSVQLWIYAWVQGEVKGVTFFPGTGAER